ncbi:hypothetical protein HNQ99_003126, partial [Rhizorhapis suberifaciens]|nr:hypothetical protein [Rhizorhapis suberifaciens]
MLSGELAVLQAAIFDGLSLDPLRLEDDGRCPAEIGVGGRHVVQALVAAPVIRLSNIFLFGGAEPRFAFYPGADFDPVIVDSHL